MKVPLQRKKVEEISHMKKSFQKNSLSELEMISLSNYEISKQMYNIEFIRYSVGSLASVINNASIINMSVLCEDLYVSLHNTYRVMTTAQT